MTSDALVFRAPRIAALLAALLLVTVGCAPTLRSAGTTAVADTGDDVDLRTVDTGGRGLFLVRPDHELGRYDEILIEEVGFRYSPDQGWLSDRDEDRINAMLAAAVEGSQDGAIGLTDEPGPCVLGVRFFVTDLELHTPELETGSSLSFVRSFGQATLVLELKDSETDEPIARFLQRRDLGGGTAYGVAGTSIHRLGKAVGVAMRDMRRQLQKITPPTSSGWNAACKGTMAKAASAFR